MTESVLDRKYGGSLAVDFCRGCCLIWFDGHELLRLAPEATLQLVVSFAGEEVADRRPLQCALQCPRCRADLAEVKDIQRDTRFTYHACPGGHGRLMTFYQFLRAKNFVRALSTSEVKELRRYVCQSNCSNCGAPIDLGGDAACRFCRTPVAMLDPEQLKKALVDVQNARETSPPDPSLPLRLAIEQARIDRLFGDADAKGFGEALLAGGFGDRSDLLADGLRFLRKLLG